MKTIVSQKLNKLTLCAGLLTGFACSAQAQDLHAYWDFTGYGSVSGGSAVTSNVFGNTSGTLSSTGTTLDGSGLAIGSGSSAGSTGLTFDSGSLSAFTGDFSIQMWFTSGSSVLTNTMLFGGTDTASQDSSLAGDDALFFGYNNASGSVNRVRPIISNGSQFGQDMTTDGSGIAASTTYDFVLTYAAGTDTFTFYVDGTSAGTMTASSWAGLDAVTNFAIGGVANPAFGDNAAAQTTLSFLMYEGALDATQVADIHNFGSDITLSELNGVGVAIPESGTYALLAGLLGLGFVAFRRRKA